MKKGELIPVWNVLQAVSKKIDAIHSDPSKTGVTIKAKLTYGITKNINLLKNEMNALVKAETPMRDKEKKRLDILKQYSEKDEKGLPVTEEITENGLKGVKYAGIEGNKEAEEAFKKLDEEYKNEEKNVMALRNEESDIKLYKIKIDCVPDFPLISSTEMSILNDIIEE
jgi:hypothetical protein